MKHLFRRNRASSRRLRMQPLRFNWRRFQIGLFVGTCLLLTGLGLGLRSQALLILSPPPSPQNPTSLHPSPQQTPKLYADAQQAQQLPISATALIQGKEIGLEVAKTFDQQAMGLMFRTELAPDRGMLFPFEPARPVAFWMKNTLIPLDMVFLHQGKVKAIIPNVPPCKQEYCPSYGPAGVDIDQVLELASGRAAELGLKVGDAVPVTERPTTATNQLPQPAAPAPFPSPVGNQ